MPSFFWDWSYVTVYAFGAKEKSEIPRCSIDEQHQISVAQSTACTCSLQLAFISITLSLLKWVLFVVIVVTTQKTFFHNTLHSVTFNQKHGTCLRFLKKLECCVGIDVRRVWPKGWDNCRTLKGCLHLRLYALQLTSWSMCYTEEFNKPLTLQG